MTAPKADASTRVAAPKVSGRYDASGMRVLSAKELAKVRRLGAKAKSFSIKASKSA